MAVVDVEAEAVGDAAGDYVEVGVGNLLTGDRAVCEVEVDPFDGFVAHSESRRQSARDVHHVSSDFVVEVDEIREVTAGEHEEVARCDRADVHDRHSGVVFVDVTRRKITLQDGAEDAELVLFGGLIAHREERNRWPPVAACWVLPAGPTGDHDGP